MRKEPWVPISLVDKSNDAMHHRVSGDTTRQSSRILCCIYTLFILLPFCLPLKHTHTHTQCKGANCWQKRANSLEWFTDGLTGATTPPPQQQQQQQQQYRKHVALENSSPISAYQYISLCGTVYIVSMDTKGHGTRKERATTTSREKERKRERYQQL